MWSRLSQKKTGSPIAVTIPVVMWLIGAPIRSASATQAKAKAKERQIGPMMMMIFSRIGLWPCLIVKFACGNGLWPCDLLDVEVCL